jgi:hypothetical protein
MTRFKCARVNNLKIDLPEVLAGELIENGDGWPVVFGAPKLKLMITVFVQFQREQRSLNTDDCSE